MCCWFIGRKHESRPRLFAPSHPPLINPPTHPSLVLFPWIPQNDLLSCPAGVCHHHLASLRAPSLVSASPLHLIIAVNENQNYPSDPLFPARPGNLPASRHYIMSCSMAWSSCPCSSPRLTSLCSRSHSNNSSAPRRSPTPLWPDLETGAAPASAGLGR